MKQLVGKLPTLSYELVSLAFSRPGISQTLETREESRSARSLAHFSSTFLTA